MNGCSMHAGNEGGATAEIVTGAGGDKTKVGTAASVGAMTENDIAVHPLMNGKLPAKTGTG